VDDRPDGWIDNAAAGLAARVHAIGRGAMFVDDIVIHRPNRNQVLGHFGEPREMLAEFRVGNGGVDDVVITAWLLPAVAARRLRIEGIDVRHSAAEPDEDAVLRFAQGKLDCGLADPRQGERPGCQ